MRAKIEKMENKEYSLPKDFAEKWITELRSGEHNSGAGFLYDPKRNCFCANGLAAIAHGLTKECISNKQMLGMAMRPKGYDAEL